ncbi:hypothetical protein BH09PSE6_BH09PSE6_21960 [soil metagenome]
MNAPQVAPSLDSTPAAAIDRAVDRAEGEDLWATPPTGSPSILTALPELKLMVGLVTGTVIVAALYFGRDVLMPLALALLLGFVLDPLVLRFKRLGLNRASAVAVTVLLAFGLLVMSGFFLGSQVTALSAQLPTYQSNIKTKLRDLRESSAKPGVFDGALRTFDTVRDEVDRATVPLTPAPNAAPSTTQRVQVVERSRTPMQQLLHWLEAGSAPLAMAGVTLVFVVLVLLDRLDLRDRLLRLWGSASLHRSTDAMDEAGRRISKYLTMQLVVNISYGVPMAAGLWLIGVPGSILWGAVAAVMRFVPYLGPIISAIFPLTLAFAVDPGWHMLLWTIALIGLLEMLVNNIVEPWLYGSSTGLSAMSLIVAATFWTALWGPIGLIMSTPLTVCLLVIGRHLPRLEFLDVLLGSQPALDTPTRVYQRLLAGDVEEAIEVAHDTSTDGEVAGFYNLVGLPVLRMAASDHGSVATAEHRLRLVTGMDALIDDLIEQHPSPVATAPASAVCLGGKWEVDSLSARMLTHALSLEGIAAERRPTPTLNADYIARLDLAHAQTVCILYFSPQPQVQARHLCKRIRRRWPDVNIVLGFWNAPVELLTEAACKELGADAVVTSISEAVMRVAYLAEARSTSESFVQAPVPEADAERVAALKDSGALDPRARALFDTTAKRAADIFDVPLAMVSLIDEESQLIRGAHGALPNADPASPSVQGAELNIPRSISMCGHVVAAGKTVMVPDIARDLRFAGNPALKAKGLRFYVGAPLSDAAGHIIGTLCLLDVRPRSFEPRELRLLEAMAADLMSVLQTHAAQWRDDPVPDVEDASSAIVGQWVPTT